MPLPTSRLGTAFETLRLATEKHGAPTVFMLTIGNLGMRLARYSSQILHFACAGYKIIDNLGSKQLKQESKLLVRKKQMLCTLF